MGSRHTWLGSSLALLLKKAGLRNVKRMNNDTGMVTRAMEQVRQFFCSLHGHDALLHFEQGRISLQCTSCGYETPGWDVKGRPEAEAPMTAKPRMAQVQLVRQRRAA